MTYAWIDSSDDSWDSVQHADDAAPEGFYAVEVPGYVPTGGQWSSVLAAFAEFAEPVRALITVGRFKLLLTKEERIAIRAAAHVSDDVADFLDLLAGFTDGVSLTDPLLVAAIGEMQAAGLLTEARAAAVLAGEAP